MGKSYNCTAEYFSCSAVAYELIQKAKSTSKELQGSPENVDQVSGLPTTECREPSIPCITNSCLGNPRCKLAPHSMKTQGGIICKYNNENKPHVCFVKDCHVPDIHWRKTIIRSNQSKESIMHTIGESEHFCTDMLRKCVCSFDSYIPNLGMFIQFHFKFCLPIIII